MSYYEVEFVKSAQKELNKLSHQTSLRIAEAINKLSADPRKGNVRPMRVGDYRVVYDIFDKKLTILIIRVRHWKEVYRDRD
jgi:mRNA interferase RelE/StbE